VTSSDPAKAPVRTTEDPQVQVSRSSANSVKVDQPQTQSVHTVSVASHGQTTEQAERIDSPPPVRFQVEIPKPLRVPGQIRVHLDPPELGQVRIDLSSSRAGIVGSLRVQSEQVRSIIEREIGQLQKTLQDAGVRVERLEVVATSPSDSRNSLHANLNNQQSWSQNSASQNAFGGTARGHAAAQNQNANQNQPERPEMLVSHGAYPTMHIGHVNLVA
jgi:flagellar hook-length control protein FliK